MNAYVFQEYKIQYTHNLAFFIGKLRLILNTDEHLRFRLPDPKRRPT
jgi:hypothetical protein